MEDTEYGHHDDDIRVVIKPGCTGHDSIHRLDMRIWEGFRAAFFADPQRQRESQWRSRWKWGVSKHINSFRKKHLRHRVSVRGPTINFGQRSGRTERRERSTDTFRARYADTTCSVGGSIGGKLCYCGEERRFSNVPVGQGVVEGWIGGEVVDWIGRDVDSEFDVASCRGRVAG